MKQIIIIAIIVSFLAGCNNYRFVPSHGGGKRFDEEERAVSAAIRNSVAQIDVGEFSGRKMNAIITSIANNGGATVGFPGFSNASASYSYNTQNYAFALPFYPVLKDQDSWSASASYNPNLSAVPTVFGTDQDITYLDAALQLKLRVNGITAGVSDPEYVLYVLVDVLGTNRHKRDSIIVWRDTLTASCELTYYIVDVNQNKIISGARRASADASYCESSIFGFAGYEAHRVQRSTKPNPMPTDINDKAIVFGKTVVYCRSKADSCLAEWAAETEANSIDPNTISKSCSKRELGHNPAAKAEPNAAATARSLPKQDPNTAAKPISPATKTEPNLPPTKVSVPQMDQAIVATAAVSTVPQSTDPNIVSKPESAEEPNAPAKPAVKAQ